MKTYLNEMPVVTAVLEIVLVLICAVIVVRVSRLFVNRIFEGRLGLNDKSNRMPTLQGLVNSVIFYVVSFIAIVMVLSRMGVNIASILAAAGVLGIAVGFGAQTLVKDVITGFFIIFENQFSVGEYVRVNTMEGMVEEIGLRITKIKCFDGSLFIIPNGSITEVVNYCRDNIRVLVDVNISYDSPVEKAQAALTAALELYYAGHSEILTVKPTVLGVQALEESAVTLRIIGFTLPMKQWEVERDIRLLAKETLNKEGIKIPFPTREIHNYRFQEGEKP